MIITLPDLLSPAASPLPWDLMRVG
jgi:hypothetical protein